MFSAKSRSVLIMMFVAVGGPRAQAAGYDVAEKSIAQLQADMISGRVTSAEIVRAYLARIDAIDRNGPALHSVIAINPHALADAQAADAARKAGKARGPQFGIPLLVKDNIETVDPVATTAGSPALKDDITHRDAPAIARLRAAGAIILGKTNSRANFSADFGGRVRMPASLNTRTSRQALRRRCGRRS